MAQAANKLLIIGSNEPTGRPHHRFLAETLDHIESADPALRRSIVAHELEAGEPSLAGIKTILFWLADPLRARFPDRFLQATEIADRAVQAGIRLVNPPLALSNTVKSIQARLWIEGGIPTPSHRVFATKEALLAEIDGLQYPVLVKSDQLHFQEGMRLCRDPSDVRRALRSNKLRAPIATAQFIDTREGYRSTRPGSLWAKFYHKKRAIVFGDVVHPRHVLFSREPIVSLKSTILAPYQKQESKPALAGKPFWRWAKALLRREPRFSRDKLAQQSVAEDNRFFLSPPEAPELLRQACRVLGLETAAIDYSVHANGEIVLWEANPHFAVITPKQFMLPEERMFAERRRRLLEDGQRFFASLVGGAR